MSTKKIKSAGRFGTRYGIKTRKSTILVDSQRNTKWTCSTCLKPAVKRLSAGIWQCKKCGNKFAGRAYRPE